MAAVSVTTVTVRQILMPAFHRDTDAGLRQRSVEALRQHPELQTFVAWVKTKPDDFFVRIHKRARAHQRRR